MYPRFVQPKVEETLNDTRVVLLIGPRQSGKTTLVTKFTNENRPYRSMDDLNTRTIAMSDPMGFIEDIDSAIIDEIHRVPDLILPIKLAVDLDPRPGRFLLTGSANLLTLQGIHDSLAGRLGIVRLLPLAQSEIYGHEGSFLDRVFAGQLPEIQSTMARSDLKEMLLRGGYPEALDRTDWYRRQQWHLDYIESIVQRDIPDIARIDNVNVMPRLLRILAEFSGQLVNYTKVGSMLDLDKNTIQRYIGILEHLFVIRTVPPWYSNRLKRLTKTPKLHFLDSGLLATLQAISPDRLQRDTSLMEPLLESFVLSELLKLGSWSHERYLISHFRDKERHEVDIVLEDRRGRVVGIEVKSGSTISKKDFSGLRKLASACGENFIQGVVLNPHRSFIPFGDRLAAAPISSLWS